MKMYPRTTHPRPGLSVFFRRRLVPKSEWYNIILSAYIHIYGHEPKERSFFYIGHGVTHPDRFESFRDYVNVLYPPIKGKLPTIIKSQLKIDG